jgi:hypothetical protein
MDSPSSFRRVPRLHFTLRISTFKPLPYIKPFGAAVPTPPSYNFALLNAVHESGEVQATITLRTTVGALLDEPKEFALTPVVPSSISAPPNPVPFIQLFAPNKTPTMLLETWHHKFLTMKIPGLSWIDTEEIYDNIWSEHMQITQTEHSNWFA